MKNDPGVYRYNFARKFRDCARCGRRYKAKSANQRYCPECKEPMKKLRSYKQRKAQHDNGN